MTRPPYLFFLKHDKTLSPLKIICSSFCRWEKPSQSHYWALAVAWSCSTLCNSVECSPLGCSVHGISQARVLEWGAIAFSRGSSRFRVWTGPLVSPALAHVFFITGKPQSQDRDEEFTQIKWWVNVRATIRTQVSQLACQSSLACLIAEYILKTLRTSAYSLMWEPKIPNVNSSVRATLRFS